MRIRSFCYRGHVDQMLIGAGRHDVVFCLAKRNDDMACYERVWLSDETTVAAVEAASRLGHLAGRAVIEASVLLGAERADVRPATLYWKRDYEKAGRW